MFIAVRNEAFMSSDYEFLTAGSVVNIELEDVEGEYYVPVGGTVPAFIWREGLRNTTTNLTQKTGHQFYI